ILTQEETLIKALAAGEENTGIAASGDLTVYAIEVGGVTSFWKYDLNKHAGSRFRIVSGGISGLDLSGDEMVYELSGAIIYYNLEKDAASTLRASGCKAPKVDSGRVAWLEDNGWQEFAVRYCTASSCSPTTATAANAYMSADLDGSWIIFSSSIQLGLDGVFKCQIGTNCIPGQALVKKNRISLDWGSGPRVSGNHAVWGGGDDVYIHDLLSGRTANIVREQEMRPQTSGEIHDGVAVWDDRRFGGADVFYSLVRDDRAIPLLSEDFEGVIPSTETWGAVAGDGGISVTLKHLGRTSMLMLGGLNDTQLTSVPLNPTGCDSLEWGFWGRQGTLGPELKDYLIMEYSPDGIKWLPLGQWNDTTFSLKSFERYSGQISDPKLLVDGMLFRLRVVADSTGDRFFVDDFEVLCHVAH
ncbi:hypothetical protein KAI87_10840, partial [Myxococcota bacterium]|nr:hypothetical protein [Myxococcota bacterium]